MNNVTSANFGLLIAYVLPGFVLLWAATPLFAMIGVGTGTSFGSPLSVGDFLNSTVAAVAAGMTVSTLRWLLLDSLHHRTGVRPPAWDFSLLGERASGFGVVVEHYYRYYQFQANTLVSLLLVLGLRRLPPSGPSGKFGWIDLGLVVLVPLFFVGSRDSLRRYYVRGGQLLSGEEKARSRIKSVSHE